MLQNNEITGQILILFPFLFFFFVFFFRKVWVFMAMFLTHARLRGIFTCIRYFIHSSFSCFFLDKALFWSDGIELFACFIYRSSHVGRSTWRSWSHEYVTSYPFYMDAWIFVTSVTITNYVFAGGVVKWWGPGFQPWLGHFFVFFFYGYFLLEVLKQLVTSRDENLK